MKLSGSCLPRSVLLLICPAAVNRNCSWASPLPHLQPCTAPDGVPADGLPAGVPRADAQTRPRKVWALPHLPLPMSWNTGVPTIQP